MKKYTKASYGGAFDIEDDQFFTREEINEVAYAVEDALNEIVSDTKFQFSEVYIEPGNILELTMYNTETEEYQTVTERIDFRKIKKPSDIMKYTAPLMRKVLDAFEISVDSIESATNTCGIPAKVDVDMDINAAYHGPTDDPVRDAMNYYNSLMEVYDVDPVVGYCEVELKDAIFTVYDGYYAEISDENYYELDKHSYYVETEYGDAEISSMTILDDISEIVYANGVNESGTYSISGNVIFAYVVSDISMYEDGEYSLDDCEFKLKLDESFIEDFDVKKLN